jgi:hypothetical protein
MPRGALNTASPRKIPAHMRKRRAIRTGYLLPPRRSCAAGVAAQEVKLKTLLISPASALQQQQQVYRVSGSSPLIDRYLSRFPWVHFQ